MATSPTGGKRPLARRPQDKNGATALHRAVRTRCAAAVACLLEAGRDFYAVLPCGSKHRPRRNGLQRCERRSTRHHRELDQERSQSANEGWQRQVRPGLRQKRLAPRTAGLARRLAFHNNPQDAVDTRLITSAVALEPLEHIRV